MQLRVCDRVRTTARVYVVAGFARQVGAMNRADRRSLLVPDGGPPHCPACGVPLFFQSDRQGRTYSQCDCGYRAYLVRRTGKLEAVEVNVAGL
jgi:hypothetical protein